MKMIFYYENGTTHTATGVVVYEESQEWESCQGITYTTKKKLAKGIHQCTTTTISKDILVAYEVMEDDTTTIRKLKPCVIVSTHVCTDKLDYNP